MNLEGRTLAENPGLLPVDRWIYSLLNGAARDMEGAFLSYRYNDAAQRAYEYFWNDFCGWYVEATKLSMREGDEAEKDRAATVLLDVLSESLRLLHPLLPFVTEEIYGKLPSGGGGSAGGGDHPPELLINAPYPLYNPDREDPGAEEDFAFLRELVRMVRTLRSECTVPPDKKVRALVHPGQGRRLLFLRENMGLVKLLAGIGELEIAGTPGLSRPAGSIGLVGSGFEAFVYIAEAVDLGLLKQKFTRDIEKDRKFTALLEAKLGNNKFLQNAPPELVAGERLKLEDALKRTKTLESYIRDMA
jgi:valyl-tRNA synthetase